MNLQERILGQQGLRRPEDREDGHHHLRRRIQGRRCARRRHEGDGRPHRRRQELQEAAQDGAQHVLRRRGDGGRLRQDDDHDGVAAGAAQAEHGEAGARVRGQPHAEADALQVPGLRRHLPRPRRRRRHGPPPLRGQRPRQHLEGPLQGHGVGHARRHVRARERVEEGHGGKEDLVI